MDPQLQDLQNQIKDVSNTLTALTTRFQKHKHTGSDLTQKITATGSGGSDVILNTSGLIDILLVGGGGNSGAGNGAGGGGGGEVQYHTGKIVIPTPYTVTVGSATNTSGFDTYTAIAGGNGGTTGGNGTNGSGGGGGSSNSGTGGTGSPGKNGGAASTKGGGGGGGFGVAGAAGSGSGAGNGGDGVTNSITGSSVYYGGGGGGTGQGGGTSGTAGQGTVGAGGTTSAAGATGIVIIRYHTDGTDGIASTSSGGTITTDGTYTYHTFTASGTFTPDMSPTSGGVTGSMLKSVYDPAAIDEQLVGLTAAQTLTNKTLTSSIQTTVAKTASTGTTTFDLSTGNVQNFTFSGSSSADAVTFALSNATTNQVFIISVTQNSGGSGTVTWFSTLRWTGSGAPTLTTTANKRDTFGFICTGTGTYDGFVVGQNI